MTRHKKTRLTPLPLRDGISANHIWLPTGNWATILDFLVFRFPDIGESVWCKRMLKGDVVDESGVVISPRSEYRVGARLFYYRELDVEYDIPFAEKIIYQDEHIVIADKPHFLPIAPAGRYLKQTLLARLKRALEIDHLVPLHRLDRETAGLVMFSKNVQTRDLYHALFRQHRIIKTYEALAAFDSTRKYPFTHRSCIVAAQQFYRRMEIAGEPNAETRIDLIEQYGVNALYKLNPVTGKTHQLRVHMAALGMPILNDAYYPQLMAWKGDDFSKPLQLLARAIEFSDPVSGNARCFVSERKLELCS